MASWPEAKNPYFVVLWAISMSIGLYKNALPFYQHTGTGMRSPSFSGADLDRLPEVTVIRISGNFLCSFFLLIKVKKNPFYLSQSALSACTLYSLSSLYSRDGFIIMRPSSLGGGRILRRTLSVCPSVSRPSVPLSLASRRAT